MKGLKKFFKGLLIVILAIILLVAVLDAVWVLGPQVKASKKISDISDYGKPGYEVKIPEGISVVALGEASHGNAEFHELKLAVFKYLVETTSVRSFALEADYGDGILINEYVHGTGDIKDAREAVAKLSFNIYQTQQMVDLVQWMHDYNQSAGEADKLSFYGFDMQNPDIDSGIIADYCEANGITPKSGSTALLRKYAEHESLEGQYDTFLEDIESVKNSLNTGDTKASSIAISCDCVLKSKALGELGVADYIAYNTVRDEAMANVVSQIASLEKELGHDMIYITGHNGHMGTNALYYTTMGQNIKEEFGDKYFIIGTDYYKTTCNITNGAGRGDYKFCSADPMAYQAKYFDNMYCINFSDVFDKQTGATYETISEPMYMGYLGESYNPMMHFMPTSCRVKNLVYEGFDAMIYVYKATPIKVLPREN